MNSPTPYVRCHAKSKRTGQQCQRPAMKGREVCYHHGGKSLRGIASKTFKHGKYSKSIPERLAARYQESLTDEELLSIRDDIALVSARLSDLLSRADAGEAGKTWKDARTAYDNLRYYMSKADKAGTTQALTDLDRLIGQGVSDHAVWDEIKDYLEQRRKLVESEQKRLVAMEQLISTEDAIVFASNILLIIKRQVADPRVMAAIQADITELLHSDHRSR